MPAEQFHGPCQVRGLDTPAACVPQPTCIDMGERLSRRSPVPDNVRTAAAECCQSGHGRLVAADKQPFESFPLHAVTPTGILLYSNRIQQPQQPTPPRSVPLGPIHALYDRQRPTSVERRSRSPRTRACPSGQALRSLRHPFDETYPSTCSDHQPLSACHSWNQATKSVSGSLSSPASAYGAAHPSPSHQTRPR